QARHALVAPAPGERVERTRAARQPVASGIALDGSIWPDGPRTAGIAVAAAAALRAACPCALIAQVVQPGAGAVGGDCRRRPVPPDRPDSWGVSARGGLHHTR